MLIHCFAGIHRTGVYCAVYRMDHDGWSNREAIAEMRALGYATLDDDLDVGENTQVGLGSPLFAGDSIAVRDHFGARNDFYGAQLGVRTGVHYEHWFLDATLKVALGDSHEAVNIHGATSVTPPGGAVTVTPAGLLALASNSGNHSRDAFAVVPTADVAASATARSTTTAIWPSP